ncbi:MAG: hypothetical protein ABTQ30_13585 [Rhizobiaceae bacterium]
MFTRNYTPENLYLDVMSISFFVYEHRFTVTETIQKDLTDPAWLDQRCAHIQRMVLAALQGNI